MKITTPQMLALAVKNARKHQNLSQQAVADRVGVKQATVSGFENHPDTTRVDTLFKLLSALDLELSLNQRGTSSQGCDPDSAPSSSSESDPESGWDQEW